MANLIEVGSLRVESRLRRTAQVFWTAAAAGGASCLPRMLKPFRLASILVICIWLQAPRDCHLLHLPACVLARRGEVCSAILLSCGKCDARCFEGSVLLLSAIYTASLGLVWWVMSFLVGRICFQRKGVGAGLLLWGVALAVTALS